MAHSAWQIDQFPTCWPMNGLFVHWSRGWGVLSFSERLVLKTICSIHFLSEIYPDGISWPLFIFVFLSSILALWWPNTVKFHYNACHYNANASLTRSILGSQTAPTCPHDHLRVAQHHGQKVWNHCGLIGHSGNDTPLFPFKWNKRKVSHLLVMSIQSIHDWSSIKHTYYSSPVLRECHELAAKRPDVENNPGSNQVNMSQTHVNWHNRDWQITVLDPKGVIKLITACKDIA